MFKSEIKAIDDKVQQIKMIEGNDYLRYSEVINLWQKDYSFRLFFISLLANVPFSAYGWETPALTKQTLNRIFEFVVLDNPILDQIPNYTAFSNYLTNSPESIITFPNLGNDALLIVPSKQGATSSYGHLASFIRHAPEDQKHDLWQKVGEMMTRKIISDAPIWLNTAGAGVPWLHVRLDSRPKYYGYQLYKTAN